jgi:predicted nucleic acid-binding protein
MYLLDTNVLSELTRPNPDSGVQRWINQHMAQSGVSTITVFELRWGVAALPAGRRQDELLLAIERAINRFGPRLYGFDRLSAEMAGQIGAACAALGRPMSQPDAQLAGIAAVYGLTLVTRNVRDFEASGVDLLSPWGS